MGEIYLELSELVRRRRNIQNIEKKSVDFAGK